MQLPTPTMCVGIDIHAEFYQVCTTDHQGFLQQTQYPTGSSGLEQLVQDVAQYGESCRVAMEACTGASHLHKELTAKTPCSAFIVDARRLRERFPKRGKKTDEVDALHLAKLVRDNVEAIWVPTEEVRELRLLTGERRCIQEARNQEMNRVHAHLKDRGIKYPRKSITLWDVRGRKWLQERIQHMSESLAQVMNMTLNRIDQLDEQLLVIDRQLARWCQDSKEAQLLLSVPGASSVGIAIVLSEIGEWKRFENPKQLTRYAGLNPTVHNSGRSVHHGRISKQGRAPLRWITVQMVLSAVKSCQVLRQFYDRIKKRTRCHGKAKVATARKMLCLFWHILKSGRPYNNERKELTASKLQQQRRLANRKVDETGLGKTMALLKRGFARETKWRSQAWATPNGREREAAASAPSKTPSAAA